MDKYNYFEFVDIIERTALSHPMVNNFYRGTASLNGAEDINYPAVVFSVDNISVGVRTTSVDFKLIYCDRLTDTRDNELEIQSAAVDIITELWNGMRRSFDLYGEDNTIELIPFAERFADNLAGATGSINIYFPSNISACDWLDVDSVCNKC